MPVCSECHADYGEVDKVCPACGQPSHRSMGAVGRVGMYSLWLGWAVSLLAAIVSVVFSIILFVQGNWLHGIYGILIGAPLCYANHVALGIAIHHARRK